MMEQFSIGHGTSGGTSDEIVDEESKTERILLRFESTQKNFHSTGIAPEALVWLGEVVIGTVSKGLLGQRRKKIPDREYHRQMKIA